MSSDVTSIAYHLQPIRSLQEEYVFLFDATYLVDVPLNIDVKSAFYLVKQKLYFEKEKYTRLIRTPITSVISVGDAIVVLGVVTELLRLLENNSDLYAISMYRTVTQDVTGTLPL